MQASKLDGGLPKGDQTILFKDCKVDSAATKKTEQINFEAVRKYRCTARRIFRRPFHNLQRSTI